MEVGTLSKQCTMPSIFFPNMVGYDFQGTRRVDQDQKKVSPALEGNLGAHILQEVWSCKADEK